ncbi:MAG: hypothetical protein QM779_01515 [Propionicimonas sp.]|uniref:hypothetical protein n=1 Tax=Propionicimonas sp. TaxID=1955623 RepID=UPI003D11542C
MTADTIDTSVGAVPVLHRLALGLVARDAVTDRGATAPLRVGWEASGHLLPPGAPAWWPCVDLEPAGGGRFRLRATPARPAVLTIRLFDPTRRYVARRLGVTPWPWADLVDPLPAHLVAVAARTLPVWLFPGAAHPVPRGTTAIRGRVTDAAGPLPWARVDATDLGGTVLGHAHGDDRGEFLLLLTDTNQNPVQSTVDVRLRVQAPASVLAWPPVEPVTRPANPPAAGDLDNPLLRGLTPSADHVPNTAPTLQVTVSVGEEHVLTDDVPFLP